MFSFRFMGYPVRVHWSFWILAFFIGGGLRASEPEDFVRLLIAAAVIFVSILVHELGHAIAAKRFGAQPSIMLYGMGGLCQFPAGRLSRGQSLAVSAAGPAAGLLFALIFIGAGEALTITDPFVWYAIGIGIFVNVVWNVLNLLPILPLDGGQILRDLLGPRNHAAARWISVGTAAVACLLALTYGFIFGAIIAGVLAFLNLQGKTMETRPGSGRP